jgi:hypothetical protein
MKCQNVVVRKRDEANVERMRIKSFMSVILQHHYLHLLCLSLISTTITNSLQLLMRLWWVWLLILFAFMAFTCNSCQESFKNKQGLSKHQRVCAKVKQTKREGLERQRKHQQKTVSVEPEDLGEELEILNQVGQFQLRKWTLNPQAIILA